MAGPILVIGCTGGFGRAMANELLGRGRPVRLFVREVDRGRAIFGNRPNGEIVEGDVLDAESVKAAAEDCAAIVHAVNFPYHRWDPDMSRATEHVLASAAPGTLIVLPGNVYGLGRQTGTPLAESAENRAETKKGRFRIGIEEWLRGAAEGGKCRALVVRAGDYYGPTVRNGLVDGVFGRVQAGRPPRMLGDPAQPHQWAYAPDLARASADLMERVGAGPAAYEVMNFAGHTFDSQRAFCELVGGCGGLAKAGVSRVPWWMVRAWGLFSPTMRELMELRYLWDSCVLLDDAKLRRVLPSFKATAPEEAVRATLNSYRG